MTVTIKDVAALAGVSPSTVSRTCKDHPSISRQTKEKVRKAMDILGYEPNFQASSLASQNSRTIGIILPPSERETYENSFFLEVIRGISLLCNQKQYINTVITGKDEEEILKAVKTMAKTAWRRALLSSTPGRRIRLSAICSTRGFSMCWWERLSEMPIRLSMWTTTMSWPAGRLPSI